MSSDAADESVDEAQDRAYLERVRHEIDEEVRRRRAAGDFPPSFERKLDELFARFTPTGTGDDHFTEALKLADRAAYFDIDVPIGSRREPKGLVKWSLWQAEAWFVRYVVSQLNHFASSSMRVLHLLDERLSDVEGDVSLLTPPALPEEEELAPGADPIPYAERLTEVLGAGPGGRVLHAECGDGSLLGALGQAAVDAYGIDPGTAAADRAVAAGFDVRRDEVAGHLGALGTDRLGGLVLSAVVDRASMAERRRLLRLAELTLVPGGLLAVVGIEPDAWLATVGPVVADLAPGRPLHAETWVHLVGRLGFTDVEVHHGPGSFAVLAVKRHAAR
ncbi:MAG TPA: methionine biosynthesis protein MetW [Acidimicrobiales bacterium]|nr:methionine biosynthesis protein MetW [Acidimicrobiales bacterium]